MRYFVKRQSIIINAKSLTVHVCSIHGSSPTWLGKYSGTARLQPNWEKHQIESLACIKFSSFMMYKSGTWRHYQRNSDVIEIFFNLWIQRCPTQCPTIHSFRCKCTGTSSLQSNPASYKIEMLALSCMNFL